MTDTQWPEFYVFDQRRAGSPPEYAGAVHAPDGEMALQNARDVFARRPDHAALWVVPAAAIYARTAEELAAEPAEPLDAPPPAEAADQRWLIFQKTNHKGTLVFSGEVNAPDAPAALAAARGAFANPKTIVWWVIPAAAVITTDPAENAPLFDPAKHKPFRHESFYPVVTLMRSLKRGKS